MTWIKNMLNTDQGLPHPLAYSERSPVLPLAAYDGPAWKSEDGRLVKVRFYERNTDWPNGVWENLWVEILSGNSERGTGRITNDVMAITFLMRGAIIHFGPHPEWGRVFYGSCLEDGHNHA